jgi:DHA2 family multidrug resistance protein
VGRIANKTDPRLLMTIGAGCVAWSLWQMAQWSPSIDFWELLYVSIVQGFGFGMVFVPLNLVAFATLPGHYRTDGSAFMNLVRNVGSAIGVSVSTTILTNSMQAIRSDLVGHASLFNRALGINAESLYYNLQLPTGQASFNGLINLRASIGAYANDFLFMFYLTLIMFPLIWLMKRPSFTNTTRPAVEAVE